MTTKAKRVFEHLYGVKFYTPAAIASAEARARLEGMKYGHNNKHIACGCLVCAEITELTQAAARMPDSTKDRA